MSFFVAEQVWHCIISSVRCFITSDNNNSYIPWSYLNVDALSPEMITTSDNPPATANVDIKGRGRINIIKSYQLELGKWRLWPTIMWVLSSAWQHSQFFHFRPDDDWSETSAKLFSKLKLVTDNLSIYSATVKSSILNFFTCTTTWYLLGQHFKDICCFVYTLSNICMNLAALV